MTLTRQLPVARQLVAISHGSAMLLALTGVYKSVAEVRIV